MVDEFGAVRLQLHGGPHHRVQVSKVVVHVDAFVAVAAQRPARQLGALRVREGSAAGAWKARTHAALGPS